MMYIRYIGIVILYILFRIIHIVWYPLILRFRSKARNIVYNYFIQNKIFIEYFSFNIIEEIDDRYLIKHNDTVTGYVMKNKVSKIKYYFYLIFVWIWLDDNLNTDLYNIKDIVYLKDKYKILNKKSIDIIKDIRSLNSTFMLGDKRNEYMYSEILPTLYHFTKMNTFNFKYIFMVSEKQKFLFSKKIKIGWELIIKENISYYILVP